MPDLAHIQGSYRAPSYEHARVSDAMRAGVISCSPDASLQTVARVMATNHVHSVVVTAGAAAPIGVVTDREVLRAAATGRAEETAGSLARDPVTAFVDDPLPDAAGALIDSGSSHLIVVDAEGRPMGVLSTLDIAGVMAWGLA